MAQVTDQLKLALTDRYLIESELGAGGMATVYLAHDVKHNRKVALKVLRPELAAVIGAERFLKEIEVTASLQHPHILPLHDSGTVSSASGGTEMLYYVMPFVEGESLRDKLDREKQLGVDEALAITQAVAAALDYAHRHDVIHRDIKPENVLLHDGQAVVADFGIALAVSQAGGSRMTETGMSIGTPHYMSPEQAMGDRELDARSDIYSLGAILYEMLVGEPPFTGPTAQAIVAKVITESAPLVTRARPNVPANVDAVIQKALEKLPADRFHSASVFADALGNPTFSIPSATVASESRVAAVGRRSSHPAWIVATILMAAVAIAGVVGIFAPEAPSRVYRLQVVLPTADAVVSLTNGRSIAISPDGSQFAYVASNGRIFLRRFDQLEAREVPGVRGALSPFFSPDGQWIGYFQTPNMMKVAVSGGPPLRVVNATGGRGATWDKHDRIVYAPDNAGPILRVPAGGGVPDTLTQTTASFSHRWPRTLPDDRGLLLTEWSGAIDNAYVAVLDYATGEIRQLFPGADAQYASTGHLVYATAGGSVLAVPFDLKRLEVTGNPVALLGGVSVDISASADLVMSDDGTLVYVSGDVEDLILFAVDREGVERTLVEHLSSGVGPRVSPDGRHVAVGMVHESNTDIYVFDLEQGTRNRRTFEGNNFYPAWSAAGDSIYFSSAVADRGRSLYRVAADGSGSSELVFERTGEQWEIVPARVGGFSVFRESAPGTGRDIWAVPPGGGDPVPYVVTEFNERGPALSPDGRWIAYMSDESGQDEIFVQAFPTQMGKWQVSSDGGTEPVWSADGRELFYRTGSDLVAVPVRTGATFSVGQRTVLFDWAASRQEQHSNYDVNPVTGEFVALRPSGNQTIGIIAVVNWFEELKERMGN